MDKHKTMRVATVVVAAATLICSIYIMVRGLGLSDKYDFGAGAYFYADSPQLQELSSAPVYKTSVPTWVHIVLFLGWGWLMYRLWVWIDRRSNRKP